ncbi:DUF7159 family protein [Mycobacterium genavense]|uniref:DUF7159 family protein n=1 Tax=Mycobacterium genavense TaxID=36812 RepID=UPI0012EB1488|nr:hypothetical protein [Mycobacterium genavense]
MVLVERENADGALVEEDQFPLVEADGTQPAAVPDRAISAILGTREGATEAGMELSSIGVTWTDQLHASVLRDALTAYKLENVMLVSSFLAAAALGQSVGGAMGYDSTAVLFVEPDTATLAVVETSDGSITDVYKEQIVADTYDEATAQLTGMMSWLDELALPPGGVFVVGSGVDVGPIKPSLDSATSLTVSAPEEPETALARGAALASANAPLFASSTAALAYAQDPGTGAVHPNVGPEYLGVSYVSDATLGRDELAYSLVPDDDADAPTVVIDRPDLVDLEEDQPRRRPVLLVGSGMAVIAISAVVALEIALAIGIRTTNVAVQPSPNQNLIVPTQPAPAPPPAEASVAKPKIVLPAPAAAPQPLHPALAAPPAAPIPAAPPPPPAAPPPVAPAVPVPVVVPVPVPQIRMPAPNWLMSPPVVQAPPRPLPPLVVVQQSPPVHIPEPPDSMPQSPPYQTPPETGPTKPNGPGGPAGGHVPPPGSGSGGANGGGPGGLPGSGTGGAGGGHLPPLGSGSGPANGGTPGGVPGSGGAGHVPSPGSGSGGVDGGGQGGAPIGGGPGHGVGGAPIGGGGPVGGGPFGGGPIGGGPIGGGPIGGGPIGGGPIGGGPIGGGPIGGGGHSGGGFGGGLGGGHSSGGGFGGGHSGGGGGHH